MRYPRRTGLTPGRYPKAPCRRSRRWTWRRERGGQGLRGEGPKHRCRRDTWRCRLRNHLISWTS